VIKQYGTKIKFDYNLFKKEYIELDFKELDKSEITDEILESIKKAKDSPKSKLINLSKEYVNYYL